ncbi:hypothetical protein JVU11DRAFT_11656 [Chiua virens]|nr:hypothetical protein JVU11DRAFT_11656 [Chiua virens]
MISLGDDEEGDEKEILSFVRDMVDHFGGVGDMSRWEGQVFILRDSPSRKERNPFKSLLRLFGKPWFSRTWVIQEFGLASTAIAMFGDQKVQVHYIGKAALILLRFFREHLVPLQVKQMVDMVHHLYTMFSPEVRFRNFTHLIDNARLFQATDPRDKIYAFLEHSLARSNSGKSFIEPDYRKSTLDVYREAAVKLIQKGQSIDILCAVQHDSNAATIDPDFPSWVPRFDKYYGSRVLGRFTSDHSASGNNDFPPEPVPMDSASNSLTVRGIFFDSICSHTLPLHAPEFDLTESDRLDDNPVRLIWSAGKLDTTDASYPSGDPMKKAFIAALTAGASSLGTFDADFASYWFRIFESGFDPDNCTAFDAQYHRALCRSAAGGSWMRFQDLVSDMDDRIVVLFGADVPMVVRPKEDGRYTLVGECYVHGIMAGQVVRTWRGLLPPGVGHPLVLNDVHYSQFLGAEPLKLELVDIELV